MNAQKQGTEKILMKSGNHLMERGLGMFLKNGRSMITNRLRGGSAMLKALCVQTEKWEMYM